MKQSFTNLKCIILMSLSVMKKVTMYCVIYQLKFINILIVIYISLHPFQDNIYLLKVGIKILEKDVKYNVVLAFLLLTLNIFHSFY